MTNITCFPNEIIFSILEQEDIGIKDVINFSLTCKKLHMAIKDNNVLWKRKLFQRLPILQDVYMLDKSKEVKLHKETDMLELRRLFRIQIKDYLLNLTLFSPLFCYICDVNKLYLKTTDYRTCIQEASQLLNLYSFPEQDDTTNRMLVRRCVDFLSHHEDRVQILGVLLLLRVTTSTPKHTKAIVSHGAIPSLVSLIKSSHTDTRQAFWILFNIIEDVPGSCDVILSHNAVPRLLDLIKSVDSVTEMQGIIWILISLCRNNIPPSPLGIMKRMLLSLYRYLTVV